MVFGTFYQMPWAGMSIGRFRSGKEREADFLKASKRESLVHQDTSRFFVSNGMLNPNRKAIRNPVSTQAVRTLQGTFSSGLDTKQAVDPNEALKALVLLGTRILQQAEQLKAQGHFSDAKLMVRLDQPERGEGSCRDVDLARLKSAQEQNKLQFKRDVTCLLFCLSVLYGQPEKMIQSLGYLAQEAGRDFQGQWEQRSQNLKFDFKSLLAQVRNKELPADTLIFSKKDRELMMPAAAAQGFDIETDRGLQAYIEWVVCVLQETAEAIEAVGRPYRLSVVAYGRDPQGQLKKTQCQEVLQG